jgi:hypothetical protein
LDEFDDIYCLKRELHIGYTPLIGCMVRIADRINEYRHLNLLTNIRQQQTSWARRVLTLFVVVWLNMAIQPCAMAFGEAPDHDCQHCPPALAGETSAHHAHDENASMDAGHSSCATIEAQCGLDDEFNHSSRTIKVKDSPGDAPVAIVQTMAVVPVIHEPVAISALAGAAFLPGDPPSLNLLYGVYLI